MSVSAKYVVYLYFLFYLLFSMLFIYSILFIWSRFRVSRFRVSRFRVSRFREVGSLRRIFSKVRYIKAFCVLALGWLTTMKHPQKHPKNYNETHLKNGVKTQWNDVSALQWKAPLFTMILLSLTHGSITQLSTDLWAVLPCALGVTKLPIHYTIGLHPMRIESI